MQLTQSFKIAKQALATQQALLGIILLLASAILPLLDDGFYLSMGITLASYIGLTTAWSMFSGPTRLVSLATAAFFGSGAFTMAVLGESLHWSLILVIAAIIGASMAAIVGMITLRLSGVYFVIFTFGLAELVRQLVTWYEVNVNFDVGRYIFIDITQAEIYWLLLGMILLIFITGTLINRSRLGFALQIIGNDETVAAHSGINIALSKVLLFAISAAFIAVIGAIMAPRWTYIEPAIAYNPMISFTVVIMALLGGVHRLWGPILGAVPLTLLFEALMANFPNHFSLLLGSIFLIIVYFVPHGVVGLIEKHKPKLTAIFSQRRAQTQAQTQAPIDSHNPKEAN